MKILFVYNGAENLGIEYLSSLLKSKGHKTYLLFDPAIFSGDQLIDNRFLSKIFTIDKKIINKAFRIKPDIIGFSVYTGNYNWCLKVAQNLKIALPKIPIIFGGVHATAVPEKVLLNDFIDYVAIGEGEGVLVNLLNHLEKKESPKYLAKIPNLGFRFNGKINLNPPRPYIWNLDNLPLPDKKIFYEKVPLFAKHYLIMTTRGCPYNCTYCSNDMYHNLYIKEKNHVRRRSPENVIEELKMAKKKWDVRLVNFGDDIFTFSLPWLQKFIPLYKSEIKLPFWCSVHPLAVSEKIIALLKEGGCWLVTMGVQSGSERIRKEIFHRYESNQKIIESIMIIKKAGIKISVDNIFGAPSETRSDLEKSLKLYNQVKVDRIMTFWLTFYPKTDIINFARRYKLISDKEINDIENGVIGFTHKTGSVDSKKVNMYLKYQILFQLRSLFHDNLIYSFSKRIVLILPSERLISKLIVFLNALKMNDAKFFYLLRFLWTQKNVP
ncbi:B12-binding domain-containing radical SAM protein [Candidatus Microgenomates bacterium]|nr:B12-binding domain-containing radical SAM protein [Candidatus Microgenomates bacterium]